MKVFNKDENYEYTAKSVEKDFPIFDYPLEQTEFLYDLAGYDGQLMQNSDLEIELFQRTIDQLKRTEMTKIENALTWLYVKTWGLQGQHVICRNEIWNFGTEDAKRAIMGMTFPGKKKNDGVNNESLRKLIMGKFDNKKTEVYVRLTLMKISIHGVI